MACMLLQLAQDLDWLGCQLGEYGPKSGPKLPPVGKLENPAVSERHRGLLTTADKIQRELINSVRFDPTRLVGVGRPASDTIDSVAEMLVAVEDIKQTALSSAQELPPKVRSLASMLRTYLDTAPTAA